jgi:hypothetical protein
MFLAASLPHDFETKFLSLFFKRYKKILSIVLMGILSFFVFLLYFSDPYLAHWRKQLWPKWHSPHIVSTLKDFWEKERALHSDMDSQPSLLIGDPVKIGHIQYYWGSIPILLKNNLLISSWVNQNMLSHGNILILSDDPEQFREWTRAYPLARISPPLKVEGEDQDLLVAIIPKQG